MENLSKLPNRLKELMFDKGVNASILAENLGIGSNTITRYLQGAHLPEFDIFVELVEYFHCSADFLLGTLEYPQYEKEFLPVPAFALRLRAALDELGVSQYALQKKTKISWNNIHKWLKGERLPLPDSLLRLAKALDCSVDYLLGRVK